MVKSSDIGTTTQKPLSGSGGFETILGMTGGKNDSFIDNVVSILEVFNN